MCFEFANNVKYDFRASYMSRRSQSNKIWTGQSLVNNNNLHNITGQWFHGLKCSKYTGVVVLCYMDLILLYNWLQPFDAMKPNYIH
jgi:hypothetical protein